MLRKRMNRTRRSPTRRCRRNEMLMMASPIAIQPMFAEVSDKVPSIGSLWIVGLVGLVAVVTFFRLSRYSLLFSLPLAALWLIGTFREFHGDSHFKSAVISEMGSRYLLLVVFTSALPLFAVLICAVWLFRSLRIVKRSATN